MTHLIYQCKTAYELHTMYDGNESVNFICEKATVSNIIKLLNLKTSGLTLFFIEVDNWVGVGSVKVTKDDLLTFMTRCNFKYKSEGKNVPVRFKVVRRGGCLHFSRYVMYQQYPELHETNYTPKVKTNRRV